jgi:hypothetical protein
LNIPMEQLYCLSFRVGQVRALAWAGVRKHGRQANGGSREEETEKKKVIDA